MTTPHETVPLAGLAGELVAALRTQAALIATIKGRGGPSPHAYSSIESFVLAHGRVWTPGPLPAGLAWGTPRQCFANAAMLALFAGRWTYCEGYVARALVPLPILHAWVVGPDGVAVDPTLRLEPGEAVAYLGVPFAAGYLAAALLKGERFGLLDRMETGWPLLSGADPAGEAVAPWPPE